MSSYNLLAVPKNGGCTISYQISNNNAGLSTPLTFVSNYTTSTNTVSLATDFPTSPKVSFFDTTIYKAGSPTDFLQFSLTFTPNLYYLTYQSTSTSSFVISNYGASTVSKNELVEMYGNTGEQTYLCEVEDQPGLLVAVMGKAKDIYDAVAAQIIQEPIPVVWKFQPL